MTGRQNAAPDIGSFHMRQRDAARSPCGTAAGRFPRVTKTGLSPRYVTRDGLRCSLRGMVSALRYAGWSPLFVRSADRKATPRLSGLMAYAPTLPVIGYYSRAAPDCKGNVAQFPGVPARIFRAFMVRGGSNREPRGATVPNAALSAKTIRACVAVSPLIICTDYFVKEGGGRLEIYIVNFPVPPALPVANQKVFAENTRAGKVLVGKVKVVRGRVGNERVAGKRQTYRNGRGVPKRRAVLTGVDLNSGYVFLAQAAPDRSAGTWKAEPEEKKARGLNPELNVSDAGSGLFKIHTTFGDTSFKNRFLSLFRLKFIFTSPFRIPFPVPEREVEQREGFDCAQLAKKRFTRILPPTYSASAFTKPRQNDKISRKRVDAKGGGACGRTSANFTADKALETL